MGIYSCGLSHQIRVAYAKVDRMKQEIKFITFYKFYITVIVYAKNDYVDDTTLDEYSKGFYLYDVDNQAWELISVKSEERYPLWETGINYEVDDTVTYNEMKYRCITSHTSTIFEDDITYWINCMEVYYCLTQAQYDDMIANGLITDETKHLYVVTDAQNTDIYEIYNDYSEFPTTVDKEIIVYAKEDYIDVTTSIEYKKGFYLYKLDTLTWELINSGGEVEATKEVEDSIVTEITSTNDTLYSINAEKTIQTVGVETTEVIKSLEDVVLDDGTEIYVGDVIELYKFIDGILVYEYSIVEEEFYNPFG